MINVPPSKKKTGNDNNKEPFVANMDVCTKFEEIKPLLMAKQESDDSSFGMVFVGEKLSAHDVIALRTSDKWCDITLAVCLEKKFNEAQHTILQDAGVDILFCCSQGAPQLSLDSGKVDSGLVLKSILAVMPSAVVVQLSDVDLLKVILRLNDNYPELFTVMYSETPAHILTEAEQHIRTVLEATKEIIQGGEKNIPALTGSLQRALQEKNIRLSKSDFVDNQGTSYEKSLEKGNGFFHVSTQIDDIYVQDGIQIITK
jgi:hypothetical protein